MRGLMQRGSGMFRFEDYRLLWHLVEESTGSRCRDSEKE